MATIITSVRYIVQDMKPFGHPDKFDLGKYAHLGIIFHKR